MPKKTRRGEEYPPAWMKNAKKQKRNRIMQIPVEKDFVETKFNGADMDI